MSVEVDVSAYCDGCHSHIYDDHVYCSGCAGDPDPYDVENAAREAAVDMVGDWIHDHTLTLTAEQLKFCEAMHESIRRGIPIIRQIG